MPEPATGTGLRHSTGTLHWKQVHEFSRFTLFAWLVLGWNVLVILWGALVRATGSGAGCGSHWPLCNGAVVPRAPAIQTIIEFTHRVTSGLALAGVVVLIVWAFRLFPKGHSARKFAVGSIALIVVEALLGAGLVLLRYVEKDASVGRAIYLSAHLANTQLLLAALALTAWYSRPDAIPARWRIRGYRVGMLLPVALIVGISGAVAALGDTLFPATSFREGVRQEMSDAAHFLLRLRLLHPGFAILFAGYVSFVAAERVRSPITGDSRRLAWSTGVVLILQMAIGGINVWLLAPVWLQIVHLFFADILWVLLVLLVAEG